MSLGEKLRKFQQEGKIKFGAVKEIPNICGDEMIDYLYECAENQGLFFSRALVAMKRAGVLSGRQFKKIYKNVKKLAEEHGVHFTDPF